MKIPLFTLLSLLMVPAIYSWPLIRGGNTDGQPDDVWVGNNERTIVDEIFGEGQTNPNSNDWSNRSIWDGNIGTPYTEDDNVGNPGGDAGGDRM